MSGVSAIARHRRAGQPSWWARIAGWKKAAILLLATVLPLCAGTLTAGFALMHRYESQMKREDILGPAAKPGDSAQPDSGPLNFLLLGSDSRDGESDQGEYPGQRSDAIMIFHVSRDREKATVVSIPRDSYVPVPPHGDAWPGGMNKLNAAFAYGGAPLAAKTITELTGVALDGAAVANFAAVRQMVDAVGGVQLCIPYDVVSTDTERVWTRGCHHFDGAAADDFIRQRHNLPGGDFARMHDQQLVVGAIAEKVSAKNVIRNPLHLDRLLVAASRALVVDQDLDLRQLALAVRKINPSDLRFVTVPASNDNLQTAAGSSVELDPEKSNSLFAALRDDTVTQWLAANPQQLSGG